jgi:predicted aspartyl protease
MPFFTLSNIYFNLKTNVFMRSITLFFVAAAMFFSSCEATKVFKAMDGEKVVPTTFKTQIPFELIDNQRVMLPVFFEKEKIMRRITLDNHAKTSIPTSVIANNAAFVRIGVLIKGKTVDGRKIDNVQYLTDSLKLGIVTINHVLTTGVGDRANKGIFSDDGVLGDNVMIKGAWKIDFEHQIITFANSIDSIDYVNDAQKIPIKYTRADNFLVDVAFDNNVSVPIEVDLGSNGTITLKKTVFDKIDVNHKAEVTQGDVITMAGTQKVTKYKLNDAAVKINGKDFKMAIRSNEKMTTNLLGMGFFTQFKFIILDYPNKSFYVSNEKMPTK